MTPPSLAPVTLEQFQGCADEADRAAGRLRCKAPAACGSEGALAMAAAAAHHVSSEMNRTPRTRSRLSDRPPREPASTPIAARNRLSFR